jgi:hypothetical protein
MRVLPLMCVALLGLPALGNADPSKPSSSAAAAPDTARPPVTTSEARSSETAPTAPDRVVTIDPNQRPPVCKRFVPTGSRIAEQRCESAERGEPTARDQAKREILRRDVEVMREQQMMREQARQAAMAEALRRRAAGQ